jgi:2-oxoglutarate ferredoxin oxidoreductase subunit alpha
LTIQLMQGNEAIAWGALAAGCRFFGGYPITPSTEVAELMARELPKVGGRFIQMEDEIASMASIIGASIGGLRSMTATSGPGFSLMQENIGYAAMAEIPCVVVNVQRGGPSTGLPTQPSQGDVMQARWGTHGDHPIIALAPGSVREAYDLTVKAFDLAEKFRTPVILLADAIIGHMREPVDLPDPATVKVSEYRMPPKNGNGADYAPYRNAPGDVPPMASFGTGYRYHITGLVHDEEGFSTQSMSDIEPWLERFNNKLARHMDEISLLEEDCDEGARTAVLSYGASARTARHAVKLARANGQKVDLISLQTVWPFPEEKVEALGERVERIIVPEMNMGQLALEVERMAGRKKVRRVNRANGEMVTPQMILDAMEG